MSRRVVLGLFALFILVGLADAVYMTVDHYAYKADPANYEGAVCGKGAACDISRNHAASEIPFPGGGPGVPISLIGGAFYLAFAALTLFRARRPDDPTPRRIALGLALLATIYSAILAGISFSSQGGLCQLCAIMYGANLALLILSAVSLGESPGLWLKRVWAGIGTRVAAITALVFVAVVGSGYAVYRVQLSGIEGPSEDAAEVLANDDVVTFDTDKRPSKGPVDAPVQIVEFSDIQCPFCRQLFDTIEAVQAARPDKVRVTFMHFPLDKQCNPMMTREFHDTACEMAAIAECAGQQDRFFEVATTLFHDGKGKTTYDELYALVAGEHEGLDMAALRACVDGPEVWEAIKSDLFHGSKAEITGTPVFFVNGHKVSGAKSREYIDALVDAVLEGRPAAQE